MRLAVLSIFLPATALAAPCVDGLVKWSSALVNSFEWFEGNAPIKPDQLIAPKFDGNDEKMTIWRVLNERDEFSQLVKIIKCDEKYVKKLDDKDQRLTFFAPNNEALEKVRRNCISPYCAILEKGRCGRRGDDDDDKDKDEMEKWLRHYIHDAIRYATLPRVVEYKEFGQNSTYYTELHAEDGSFGKNRRRVKVESTTMMPRQVTLNVYAVITESDIKTSNGIIHKIDTPLALPPDITDSLFYVPHEFSTTLAALEKIALQDKFQFNSDFGREWNKKHRNDRHGKGYGATTFFAPTNAAWQQLPRDLQMYLFSPFGETALRKLLAFHTIPNRLVFSEWYDRVRDDGEGKRELVIHYDDNDKMGFEWEEQFPSMTDQKLPVRVKKYRGKMPGSRQYNVEVQAHGLYARKLDIVAQNGAIHVLDDVLSPRSKEGVDKTQNQKDWNEWKDWLFKWAKNTDDDSDRV